MQLRFHGNNSRNRAIRDKTILQNSAKPRPALPFSLIQVMTTANRMSQLKEAEPGREMEGKVQTWAQSLVYTLEELECKICYNRYDTRSRKPKLLGCLHRVCAKCLKKMVDMGESSPSIISCPFCRHETHVPDEEVWLMEDDRHILAVLSCQDRARRGAAGGGGEVVLSPSSLTGKTPPQVVSECFCRRTKASGDLCLSAGGPGGGVDVSHRSSDCLVITIMELPEESPSSDSLSMLNVVGLYRPPSLDSLPCNLPAQKCRAWTSRSVPRCLLGALCLVYFSSLPLGIYLLMIGQLWLGVVLVSLVPSTLLLLVLYGFCQCLCHELMEALAARSHTLP
ncbi:E3 ubiquitin-protein ligase RNF182 isoform X1 [Acanthochromis polyacanthus]|uniref:E3 ubiquitin-protein ligase RNF182 isoform X1 n=1 Tax=Acanthochromis polyacanthus TaxID=80966 RepID=UPI002233E6C5|nr:E3 ubiquitin-protein ligase RNF182 isoform X1 [Acanthochromis polyacanthus]